MPARRLTDLPEDVLQAIAGHELLGQADRVNAAFPCIYIPIVDRDLATDIRCLAQVNLSQTCRALQPLLLSGQPAVHLHCRQDALGFIACLEKFPSRILALCAHGKPAGSSNRADKHPEQPLQLACAMAPAYGCVPLCCWLFQYTTGPHA